MCGGTKWHAPSLGGIARVVLKPVCMYNLYRTTNWTNYVNEYKNFLPKRQDW